VARHPSVSSVISVEIGVVHPESMTGVDVESTITIDRPRDEVAAFASDPDNVTQWYENIKSVEWETPPPVRPGSRVAG
jgi:uncharacterized membrane protein